MVVFLRQKKNEACTTHCGSNAGVVKPRPPPEMFDLTSDTFKGSPSDPSTSSIYVERLLLQPDIDVICRNQKIFQHGIDNRFVGFRAKRNLWHAPKRHKHRRKFCSPVQKKTTISVFLGPTSVPQGHRPKYFLLLVHYENTLEMKHLIPEKKDLADNIRYDAMHNNYGSGPIFH